MSPAKKVAAAINSLVDVFSEVPDPRVARTRAHSIENVLTMAFLGAIAGAEGWDDLANFAQAKQEVLSQFLELPHGTPSADTFRRVFEALAPQAFQDAFRRWVEPLLSDLKGQTIALDGKTMRGALARARGGGGPFHLVHLWATEHRVLLGQVAVGGAGDEVPAALELLRSLDIKGTTVTADANSCASEVTQAIRDGGGHYILALKGNRGALHDQVEHCFAVARGDGYPEAPPHVTGDQAHGRTERRFVRAMPMGQLPPNIRAPWAALNTIVQVERVRLTDHLSVHRSYYITSHPPHAAKLAVRIRDHWKIENELHYCLDVTFGEDRRAIRSEYGAQNFALVCRYALSLLKRDPTKLSVAAKKKKASWSESYFLEVLASGFSEI